MKLETQLTIYGPRNLDFNYTKAGLRHDALMAHALVFAIASFNEDGSMEKVAEKAAKLLAEWGVE